MTEESRHFDSFVSFWSRSRNLFSGGSSTIPWSSSRVVCQCGQRNVKQPGLTRRLVLSVVQNKRTQRDVIIFATGRRNVHEDVSFSEILDEETEIPKNVGKQDKVCLA